MPEIIYQDSTRNGFHNYSIEVPFNKWLRGKEAYDTGFMYTREPEKFDILGFIIKACGYSLRDLVGLRVPSQYAQIKHASGHPMQSIASFLTTPGHADTEKCITLGMINDNMNIDDNQRQSKIIEVLSSAAIGVRFTEKEFESLSFSAAILEFSKLISFPYTESEQSHQMIQDLFLKINKSHFNFAYGIFGPSAVIFMYTSDVSQLHSFNMATDNPLWKLLSTNTTITSSCFLEAKSWFNGSNISRLGETEQKIIRPYQLKKINKVKLILQDI
jgi:hypothetical protein